MPEVQPNVLVAHWSGTLFPAFLAARTCYSKNPLERMHADEREMEVFLQDKIVNNGHLGVLEHIVFTFFIDGISRAASHQLVRHRVASFCQNSQRYIEFKDEPDFVVPPSDNNSEIEKVVKATFEIYKHSIMKAEDARFVLPNACATKLVMTVNARQLIEISRKRLCRKAQWEIVRLFGLVKNSISNICPLVANQMGPYCAFGKCPESKGCGV